MKTKIKRHSRSVLAVVLTLCILVSCMTVGIIATDAAKVTGNSEAVGATADSESVGTAPAAGSTVLVKMGVYYSAEGSYYAYLYNNSTSPKTEVWVPMTKITSGYYSSDKDGKGYSYFNAPSGTYEGIIIVRCETGKEGHWDNKWNQTADCNYNGNYYQVGDSWVSGGKETLTSTTRAFQIYDTVSETSQALTDTGNGVYTYSGQVTANSNTTGFKFNDGSNWYGYSGSNYTFTTVSGTLYNISATLDIKNVYKGNNNDWTGSTFVLTEATTTLTTKVMKQNFDATSAEYSAAVEDETVGTASANPSESAQGETSLTSTLSASLKDSNYEFKGWYTDAACTTAASVPDNQITINSSTTLYALFQQKKPAQVDVSASVQGSGGSVSITSGATSGKAYKGATVTFTATPNNGYKVEGWYSDSACTTAISGASGTTYTTTISGTTNVYVKFAEATWPPTIIDDDYKEPASSDTNQFYVSKSNGLDYADSSNTHYYYGGNTNPDYKMLQNGSKYWIVLSSTDLALVQQNEYMYFAFSTQKQRSGLSTNSSTSVNSDATMNYSITETAKQDYRFGDSTTYYYARVKTSADRSDIEYAGVLYDKDTNTYTIYYSSPGAHNKVNVYAKNGTVRSADNGADSMVSAYLGTTTVAYTASDNISQTALTTKYWSAYNSDHSKASNATKVDGNAGQKVVIKDKDAGATLKITTTVKDDYKDKWYVKGFSVNGGTTEAVVDGWSADKAYNEFTLHIDSESDEVIEITPIYFPKETTSSVTEGGQTYDVSNTVRFYVTGYDKAVQDAWGNTVAAYSYINGGYTPLYWPGQPMVNEGGRFYVDVERNNDPLKSQGMALSNYSWDDIHYDIFLKGTTTRASNGNTVTVGSQQQGNKQTYDFNDFSVLANTDAVRLDDEDIIFSFKYTPGVDGAAATDNFGGMNRNIIAASYTSSQMNVDPDTKDSFNNKEYLTDFYGNKVDLFGNKLSESDLQKTPLRVVSQGYDDTIDDGSGTNIGHYGTAWAIYQQESNGSFNRVGLYSSQSKLIAMEETDTFYTAYKNTPVLISYEYSIYHKKGNASSCNKDQPAERCDGRWYVSSSTETLKGHTIIQYTNATTGNQPDASYSHDWFNDQTNIDYTKTGYDPSKNKGQTTLATASFTNIEVRFNNTRGYTEATLNSSGDYSFNYEVTEDPNSVYTFEGWYLYSEGKYTFITKQRSWSSVANSNDVFVARFYKTPDGSVTISHSLVSSEGDMGFADCNVQIDVINDENTTIFSSPTTVGGYKITPDKIKAGYKLAVTLTTDVKDGSYWDNFYATNARTNLLSGYTPNPDYLQDNTGFTINNETATFTVDINKLFDNAIEGTKSLAYYSSVKSEYYTITYQYRSRLWSKQSNDSTFNLQTYTVTGKFDPDTFEKYAEYRINENGKYVMLKSAQREEFLAIHAPYEDNFQRTITWNFGDGTADRNTGHDLSITVGYTESDVPTLNFTYKVPYSSEYQSVTEGIVATELHDGIPVKNTDTQYYKTTDDKYLTVGFMKRYTVSQKDESSFLQAAPEIWNSTTNQKEYFQYWAMRDFDGNLIRKCYSNQFNMAFYESYMIEAIYDTKKTTPSDVAEATGITAQIDFLENSRNQWNNNGGGDLRELMQDDNSKKYWYRFGDRIFSDFVLTYNYNNKLINSLGDSGVEAGVLIEQVQKLDKDAKGFFITDIAHYNQEYSTTNAKHYLSNQSYTGKFIKDVVTTQLDNKNSLEYYYQFANIKQAKNENDPDKVPTTNKEYLYRAYTYIKDSTTTVVSTPVYFTIYDIASIANYSESEHYSSN